jgi:hypothetical protein
MVESEVTRTTACRARACSGETEDRLAEACLAEAAAVLRLERAFELLQVHYRCCMLPRCLHANNGWQCES